jgi:hypothetical protein
MAHVTIATPSPGSVATGYVRSLFQTALDLLANGHKVSCDLSVGTTDIASQRNILATNFLETDSTHLLFVDSDMVFPADLCRRLLGHDKPLIG